MVFQLNVSIVSVLVALLSTGSFSCNNKSEETSDFDLTMINSGGIKQGLLNIADALEKMAEDITQNDSTKDAMNKTINELKLKLNELDNRLNTLEKIAITEAVIPNGEVIMKIQNFSLLQNEAKLGKNKFILSRPFFSHKFGYKMELQVYPNGDGNGKNTHLSIFLAIIKGPYDDSLTWPINCYVSLKVLDQVQGINHIRKEFKYDDGHMGDRMKPAEKNDAFGYPRYAILSDVKNPPFLVNDTIYVKTKVITF